MVKSLFFVLLCTFQSLSFAFEVDQSLYVSGNGVLVRNNSLESMNIYLYPNDTVKFLSDNEEGYLEVEAPNGEIGLVKSKYLVETPLTHPFALTKEQLDASPYQIEILEDDKVHPTFSDFNGHVALRVRGPGIDKIYDFGRYGGMWGKFNTEGEPVLRLWNETTYKYFKRRIREVGTKMHRFVFKANKEQVENVIERIESSIIQRYRGERNIIIDGADNFTLSGGDFHYLKRNCTTVSSSALIEELNLSINSSKNVKKYGKMSGLRRSHRNAVKLASRSRDRKHIWWPTDLKNLLIGERKKLSPLMLIQKWSATEYNNKVGQLIYKK